MSDDARHGHGTGTPWWAKGEVELVVLDILAPGDGLLDYKLAKVIQDGPGSDTDGVNTASYSRK